MSANTDGPAVTITRCGPLLKIAPATEHLRHLRVGRVESAGDGSTDSPLTDVALCGISDPDFGGPQPVVWAGLEPVVRGLFKAHSVPFTIANNGVTAANMAAVAAAVSTTAAEVFADPAVVSFVADRPRGLVRYGSRVDVLRMIAELCRAVAGVRVVVIVRTRAAAGRLRALLHEFGIDAAVVTGKCHEEQRAVTVCTLGATGRAGIERAGLVLVADALHSTWVDPLVEAPIPHEIWLQSDRRNSHRRDPRLPPAVGLMDRLSGVSSSAKVIGFLPLQRSLSPFEQARAWQIYGFDELVVPRHGAVERPVVAAFSGANVRRSVPAGADELGAKKAVWHDGYRIRTRSKLASKLMEGSEHLLRLTFSSVAAGLTDYAPKAVLVLCEGIDQAKAIRREVPGWPLVTGLDDSARDVETANANPAGGVIATALGAEKLSGAAFDVVVRADPGRGLPPLPPRWLESEDANPRPLLVADIADEGHHLPALWARMRKRAYLAAGWARAGADPDVTAWERFRALVLDREERP